jgi:hypothetical protein
MCALRQIGRIQIGNRARHAQNAVKGTGGQRQALKRLSKKLPGSGVDKAVTIQLCSTQQRIGLALPCYLAHMGSHDAQSHSMTVFSHRMTQQLGRQRHLHLDLQIDTIQQRA